MKKKDAVTERKINDLRQLRKLLRGWIKHGKAGPHSNRGYKRHPKHKGKEDGHTE